MSARDKAKEYLVYYFNQTARTGGGRGFRCDEACEIEAIVDFIVDAAVEEMQQRLSDEEERRLKDAD